MRFIIDYWLRYKRQKHRQVAPLFFALAAVLSAILLVLIFRQTSRLTDALLPSSIDATPDFSDVVMRSGGSEYNSVHVGGPESGLYLVGYRKPLSPAVMLVKSGGQIRGHRMIGEVELNYGDNLSQVPVFETLRLGSNQLVLARLAGENGFEEAYLLQFSEEEGISIAYRQTPLSSQHPSHFKVGAHGTQARSLYFGDLNADGNRSEILVTIYGDDGQETFEAYTWDGSQVRYDLETAELKKNIESLFAGRSRPEEIGTEIAEETGSRFLSALSGSLSPDFVQ